MSHIFLGPVGVDNVKARYVLMPGPDHHEAKNNRQDQLCVVFQPNLITQEAEAAFVGCDGCSASTTSEAGAAIFSQVAAHNLALLVKTNGLHAIEKNMTLLYAQLIQALRMQVQMFPYGDEYLALLDLELCGGQPFILEQHPHLKPIYYFIDRNFMFTVVGGYVGESGVLAFQRGDGGHWVEGCEVYTESHQDFPPYLGYALMPPQKIVENLEMLNQNRKASSLPDIRKLPSQGFSYRFYPGALRVAFYSDGLTRNGGVVTEVINPSIWERLDRLDVWSNTRNTLRPLVSKAWKQGLITDDVFLFAMSRELMPELG